MRFLIYQESRPGGRQDNEDRVGYFYTRDALLMVAADGMGGHNLGEVAAEMAVHLISRRFQQEAKPALRWPLDFLREALYAAHDAIMDYAERTRLTESPRTTCVACVVQNGRAYWAHSGDSRLYLFQNGRLMKGTRDHSHLQRMLDSGMLSLADAQFHPARNRIYSCLGGVILPQISISEETPLRAGDVIVLSTDGFWDLIPVQEIEAAIKTQDILTTMPKLMDQADQRGGARGDNFSIVAMSWEPAVGGAAKAVSTAEMAQEGFTSEMRLTLPLEQPTATAVSDVEIDQAIAEIQSAIRRHLK